MKHRLILVAEVKEETVELLSEWTFLIEWLRTFVVDTLGLNIVELKIEPIKEKGDGNGDQ